MRRKQNLLFQRIQFLYHFIRYDIWRITEAEISKTRAFFYNALKTLLLAFRGFSSDQLQTKASALTYYTLFAVVPMLALIVGIGKGFGFQDALMQSITDHTSAQADVMPMVLGFVDKYLQRVQGGLFIGIGFAVLLWSVMAGFRQVEITFNEIWRVSKQRSFVIQFTTYFSLMFILPLFLVLSSGMSIFLNSNLNNSDWLSLFSPVVQLFIQITPFLLNWLLFTLLFMIIPNTRVRFVPALVAGVFTGTIIQLFQFLYIQGQVYLSSYNVVYGSFAIIPLLLLWLQTSWLIILFGAELSFAAQNISNFEFEADSDKISRRYKDFLILTVMKIIIKRFENGEEPLCSEEISKENAIPIRLVRTIVSRLISVGLLSEVNFSNTKTKYFQPAVDINKLTVSFVLEKIELQGSENFKVDKKVKFAKVWKTLIDIKQHAKDFEGNVLIKDL